MNSKISSLVLNYKNRKFSNKDLDTLKSINANELIELISLTDLEIRDFLVKAYFTTYDEKVVREAEEDFKDINKVFSNVWVSSALESTSESITEAFLGVTFLTTDFVSRIRSSIENKRDLSQFESQVYNLLQYLKSKREEERLLNAVFMLNTDATDNQIISSMDGKNKKWSQEIIQNLEFSNIVWEYYISVAKGENSDEQKSSLNEYVDMNDVLENIFPSEVAEKIKPLLKATEKTINFSELITSTEKTNDIVFEDVSEESVCKTELKKETLKKSFDNFKSKIKNSNENKNKKRNLIKKTPQKRGGNGKFILLSIIVMLSIAFVGANIMSKSSQTKEVPLEKVILKEGLEATINLQKVDISKE